MRNCITKFITFSNRFPFILFGIIILLTAAQIFYLKDNFHVNSDLQALFDGENETVKDLKQLSDRIGSIDTLSVVSKAESREKNREFLKVLTEELEKEKMVQYVEFEQDISYLEERALLFLSTEELTKIYDKVQSAISKEVEKNLELDKDEAKKENTVINENSEKSNIETELDDMIAKIDKKKEEYTVQKYYANNDGTMMEIKIHPNIDNSLNMSETKKMIALVDSIVKKVDPSKYGVEIETGGDFKNKLKQTKTIQNDLFSTIALCVFLLALTIIFYFRTFSSLFIVLLPLSFGIISGISGSLLIVKEFSLISAFSFAMLYGLGIDFAIHLLSRYSEERSSGKTIYDSLIKTYGTTISSIFSGAVTTALAFFSLILVQFKGFSDFGIVAGIGVITSLIAITAFFPAFIVVFEKIKPVDKMPRKIKFLSGCHAFLIKNAKTAILTSLILFILAVISSFFIKFEYDMGNLSYPHKETANSLYYQYQQSIKNEKRNQIDRSTPNYILTDSVEEAKDAYDSAVKEINVKKGGEFIRAVLSIFTFIPDNQDEKLRIIAKTKRLIERKINLFSDSVKLKIEDRIFPLLDIKEKIEMEKLPKWIKDKTSEKDGSYGKIVKMTISGNKKDIRSVLEVKKNFGSIKGEKKDYRLLGTYFLLADIKHVIDKEVPFAITLAFFVVFITIMLMFKSVKYSFFVLLPLTAGLFYMIFSAYISGTYLTLFNMIVIPTIIGIGIDSSIHIFHRYKSDGKDAIPKILETTGGAVFFSSLTTFTGFMSMAFATHKGIKSIGIMASIGITTVTIASLVIFPVILRLSRKLNK